MGTQYTLATQKDSHSNSEKELSLCEHSCLLDIMIDDISEDENSGSREVIVLRDMTPDQIRSIAIKMIESASYFTEDPEEFIKESSEFLNNSYNNFPIVKNDI